MNMDDDTFTSGELNDSTIIDLIMNKENEER